MEKKDVCSNTGNGKVPLWTSCRVALSIMGFFAVCNMYTLRVNFSVGVVCMVKTGNGTQLNYNISGKWTNATLNEGNANGNSWNATAPTSTMHEDTCESLEESSNSRYDVVGRGEFEWSKKLTGLILSSFFYGYILTQIFSGWLSERYGSRHVLGAGLSVCCAMTLLTPLAARTHPYLVIAVRTVMGMAAAVTYPAMTTLWGRWAPPLERTKLMTFSCSGDSIGTVVATSGSGFLCKHGFDNGWGSVFYVYGILSLICLFCWYYMVYDSPSQHPRITVEEQRYIESAIGICNGFDKKKLPVPWRNMVSSGAVWAIIIAHMCNNWGLYLLNTNLPMYMKEVLKFDIEQNVVWAALPYIFQMMVTVMGGQVSDLLLQEKILNPTKTRKLCGSIGGHVPGIIMAATGFLDCTNRMVAVVLITVAIAVQGAVVSGYQVNCVDIAPRFAGVLFGISNTLATIPGMIVPSFVAALTPNKAPEEWRTVLLFSGGVWCLGSTVYVILGTGELQPWAIPKEDVQNKSKEHEGEDNMAFSTYL